MVSKMEKDEDNEKDTHDTESPTDETEYREIQEPEEEDPIVDEDVGDVDDEDASVSEVSSETDRIEDLEENLREMEEELSRLRDEVEERLEEHETRLDELTGDTDADGGRSRSRSLGPIVPSERPAKAAGVILGVTGLLGIVAALATAAVTLSPGITSPFLDAVGREAAVATAGISLLLSVVVLLGGWWSYRTRRWYYAVFAGIVAAVFVTPLGLPALVLIAFAEPVFE